MASTYSSGWLSNCSSLSFLLASEGVLWIERELILSFLSLTVGAFLGKLWISRPSVRMDVITKSFLKVLSIFFNIPHERGSKSCMSSRTMIKGAIRFSLLSLGWDDMLLFERTTATLSESLSVTSSLLLSIKSSSRNSATIFIKIFLIIFPSNSSDFFFDEGLEYCSPISFKFKISETSSILLNNSLSLSSSNNFINKFSL